MGRYFSLFKKACKSLHLWTYISKMRGGNYTSSKFTFIDSFISCVGGMLCIFILLSLTNFMNVPWLMASFGASIVLVFGVWYAPFSQPRNVILGHLLTALTGLSFFSLFGSNPYAISLGVGLGIFLMAITGFIHPPAASNPVIIMLGGYSWSYLFMPVLIGTLIIVFIGLIFNNLIKTRKYPLFW